MTDTHPTEDERIPDEPVHPVSDCSSYQYAGLSKRELFAAMAMQNLAIWPIQKGDPELAAVKAVDFADALLKELAK